MRKFLFICLCCALMTPSLRAGERYFVVLFASQNSNADERRAHTFATFLNVDIGEPDQDGKILTQTIESTTISWFPGGGRIQLLARPETGRNVGLQESLEWARDNGLSTTARGPFEISRDIRNNGSKAA